MVGFRSGFVSRFDGFMVDGFFDWFVIHGFDWFMVNWFNRLMILRFDRFMVFGLDGFVILGFDRLMILRLGWFMINWGYSFMNWSVRFGSGSVIVDRFGSGLICLGWAIRLKRLGRWAVVRSWSGAVGLGCWAVGLRSWTVCLGSWTVMRSWGGTVRQRGGVHSWFWTWIVRSSVKRLGKVTLTRQFMSYGIVTMHGGNQEREDRKKQNLK